MTKKNILSGVKGYGAKKFRCSIEGETLRRMAQESQGARSRTKLIGKSTWFKRKGKKGSRKEERKGAGGKKTKEPTAAPRTTPKSVRKKFQIIPKKHSILSPRVIPLDSKNYKITCFTAYH